MLGNGADVRRLGRYTYWIFDFDKRNLKTIKTRLRLLYFLTLFRDIIKINKLYCIATTKYVNANFTTTAMFKLGFICIEIKKGIRQVNRGSEVN